VAWMGESQRGVTAARLTLPAAASRTPYDRLGDYVPWTAVAIVALFALTVAIRRRSDRGKGGAPGGDEAEYSPGSGLRVPG
jgi:apolipoprotein N-acyltransferase